MLQSHSEPLRVSILLKFGPEDPEGAARAYVVELGKQERESREKVRFELSTNKLIKNGEKNSPSRFIKQTSCTNDGEMATITSYSIDQDMIDQESRFDALFIIKYLLKRVNLAKGKDELFSVHELVRTLKDMNMMNTIIAKTKNAKAE